MNALPLKIFSRVRLKRFISILFTPPPHSWSTNLIQNSGLAMHSRITIKAQTIIPLIVSHFSLPLNGTVSLNGKSSNWRASRCAVRCLCWVCFYTCCDGGLEIFRFKSRSIVIQVHKKRDLQEQILPLVEALACVALRVTSVHKIEPWPSPFQIERTLRSGLVLDGGPASEQNHPIGPQDWKFA